MVTGPIKSTPFSWLSSVFANIKPPNVRKIALVREIDKIMEKAELQIHNNISGRTGTWLISSTPLCMDLDFIDFEVDGNWRNIWNEASLTNSHLVNKPNDHLEGYERKT